MTHIRKTVAVMKEFCLPSHKHTHTHMNMETWNVRALRSLFCARAKAHHVSICVTDAGTRVPR